MKKTNKKKYLPLYLVVIVVLLLSALYWFAIDSTAPVGENGTTEESQFRGPVGEPFITGPTEPPPYNIEQ